MRGICRRPSPFARDVPPSWAVLKVTTKVGAPSDPTTTTPTRLSGMPESSCTSLGRGAAHHRARALELDVAFHQARADDARDGAVRVARRPVLVGKPDAADGALGEEQLVGNAARVQLVDSTPSPRRAVHQLEGPGWVRAADRRLDLPAHQPVEVVDRRSRSSTLHERLVRNHLAASRGGTPAARQRVSIASGSSLGAVEPLRRQTAEAAILARGEQHLDRLRERLRPGQLVGAEDDFRGVDVGAADFAGDPSQRIRVDAVEPHEGAQRPGSSSCPPASAAPRRATRPHRLYAVGRSPRE